MKNLVRISFLALALVLAGMTKLSADGTLSCGIPCSTFNNSRCIYWYDAGTDSCVSADWLCPWATCA